MADEKTFSVKFQVKDDGSIVLDKITGKLADMGKKTQESFGKISSSLSLIKYDAIVNLAERAYQAGQRVYDFARTIASSANEIERLSRISGLSSDAFQKWQYAAKMSDVSVEELSVGMKRLSANMSEAAKGEGIANEAFAAMKINAKDAAGNLKPFDTILKEIAQKFQSWEDGPNKIALALALFGRSGEALIPLLNRGAAGIEAYFKQAERLKIIIDPSLLDAGTKAEDAFKRLNAQWEVGKLRLAPYAQTFAEFLEGMVEKLNKLKEWASSNPKIWNFLTGLVIPGWAKLGLAAAGAPGGTPSTALGYGEWEVPEGKKTVAPGIEKAKYMGPEAKDILAAWEAIIQKAEETYQIWKANNEQFYLTLDEIRQIDIAAAKVVTEAENLSEAGKLPDWRESLEMLPAGFARIDGELIKLQDIYDAMNIEAASWVKEWVKNSYGMNEAMKTTEDIAASIGNSLVSAFGNAAHGFTKFSETVKNLGLQILSMIEQMILKMIIFGSITGAKQEGGGYGGLIGIFTKLVGSFQSGTEFVPSTGLAMLHRGERVIPADQNTPGQAVTHYHIYHIVANDAPSFIDMCRRNPAGIMAAINSDAKGAGTMRNLLKGIR